MYIYIGGNAKGLLNCNCNSSISILVGFDSVSLLGSSLFFGWLQWIVTCWLSCGKSSCVGKGGKMEASLTCEKQQQGER